MNNDRNESKRGAARSFGNGKDRQPRAPQSGSARDDRPVRSPRGEGANDDRSSRFSRGDNPRDGRNTNDRRDSSRRDDVHSADLRPEWQRRVARPVDQNKPKSPPIPDEITEKDLELGIRVQLKTLSEENAERVARHLAMVALLIDQDPELAHRHALAAAERAGRIALVRETVGSTAYAVGDYALALRELATYRRISGSDDQIPLMVDSERGLGRPKRALELGRTVDKSKLAPGVRVNLSIALSGARLDLGENEQALIELQIPELNPERVFEYSPALFFAYADTLEVLGRESEAKHWIDLGNRAASALSQAAGLDDVVRVFEEIEIPDLDARMQRAAEAREKYGVRPRQTGSNNRDSSGSRNIRSEEKRGNREERGSRQDRGDRDERSNRSNRGSESGSSAPQRRSGSYADSQKRVNREGSRNRDWGKRD